MPADRLASIGVSKLEGKGQNCNFPSKFVWNQQMKHSFGVEDPRWEIICFAAHIIVETI